MFYDQRGLPLTAANEQAVLSYDATINAYLGFQLTTGTHLKEGLAADDNMPMLHILRGYFMKLFAVPALEEKAHNAMKQQAAPSPPVVRINVNNFITRR